MLSCRLQRIIVAKAFHFSVQNFRARSAVAAGAGRNRGQGGPRVKGAPVQIAPEVIDEVQDVDPTILPKRKVALSVAYVGTQYRGMQLNRLMAGRTDLAKTIEDCLEWALMKAGLMRKSNYGALDKVDWSRSSRTDKGVHSLATVVSFKIHCNDAAFDADPEGLVLASSVNRHLPGDVRVVSVQRVPSGFNARRACIDRTYQYYLPAAVLGLELDGGQRDRDRLELLNAVLQLYLGNRPYHNYTKRRRYVPDHIAEEARASQAVAKAKRPRVVQEDDDEDGAADAWLSDLGDAAPLDEALGGASGDDASAADGPEGGGPELRRRGLRATWVDSAAAEAINQVYAAHWRKVYRFEATEPFSVGQGGGSCVLLTVHGNSFLFNQIRRMVGTAVAVVRGVLPLEMAAASLSVHCSCTLPLAPPSTLVLAGNTFMRFRFQEQQPSCVRMRELSGEQLALREGGRERVNEFRRDALEPQMERLLGDELWDVWLEDLRDFESSAAELDEVLESHRRWEQALADRPGRDRPMMTAEQTC